MIRWIFSWICRQSSAMMSEKVERELGHCIHWSLCVNGEEKNNIQQNPEYNECEINSMEMLKIEWMEKQNQLKCDSPASFFMLLAKFFARRLLLLFVSQKWKCRSNVLSQHDRASQSHTQHVAHSTQPKRRANKWIVFFFSSFRTEKRMKEDEIITSFFLRSTGENTKLPFSARCGTMTKMWTFWRAPLHASFHRKTNDERN